MKQDSPTPGIQTVRRGRDGRGQEVAGLKAAGLAELHIYQGLSGADDLCHTLWRTTFRARRVQREERSGWRLMVLKNRSTVFRKRKEGHQRTPDVSWSLIAAGLLVWLPQPAGRIRDGGVNESRSYFVLTKWRPLKTLAGQWWTSEQVQRLVKV